MVRVDWRRFVPPRPALAAQCIQFLKLRGLREEGLLRVPGRNDLIQQMKDAFDAGATSPSQFMTDPHSVAGVLKLYFRELADCVIPMAYYRQFTALNCKMSSDKDKKIGTQRSGTQLSATHRTC